MLSAVVGDRGGGCARFGMAYACMGRSEEGYWEQVGAGGDARKVEGCCVLFCLVRCSFCVAQARNWLGAAMSLGLQWCWRQ